MSSCNDDSVRQARGARTAPPAGVIGSRTTRALVAAASLLCVPALAAQGAAAQETATPVGVQPVPRADAELDVRISLAQRMLWVMDGRDTVYQAPVAVASNERLRFGDREWRFATPRGRRTVLGKRVAPEWRPPDWHYAEVAKEYGLQLRRLPEGGLALPDGRRIVVRDSVVGLIFQGDSAFAPLPVDEHVVFDSTLFIPPLDTRNREVRGPLGDFALDLGNGYLLHGTDDPSSIGKAATHGCIRLRARDIAWVFSHVPIGAEVEVF